MLHDDSVGGGELHGGSVGGGVLHGGSVGGGVLMLSRGWGRCMGVARRKRRGFLKTMIMGTHMHPCMYRNL